MKITSDLTNLTTAILILTVQMFIEWTLNEANKPNYIRYLVNSTATLIQRLFDHTIL
jgi:hypothetical protein